MYTDKIDDDDFNKIFDELSDPEYVAQAAAAAAIAAQSLNKPIPHIHGYHHNHGHHHSHGQQQQQQSLYQPNPPSFSSMYRVDPLSFNNVQHYNGTAAMNMAAAAAAAATGNSSTTPTSSNPMMSMPNSLANTNTQVAARSFNNYTTKMNFNNNNNSNNNVSASSLVRSSAPIGSEIGYRLRAASDMYQRGEISTEQKAIMKNLALAKDPVFIEELERAMKTYDVAPLKELLEERRYNVSTLPSGSIDAIHLGENGGGKDRSDSGSSIGNVVDIGMTRKRNASTSTPIQRSHKSIAASIVSDNQTRVPVLQPMQFQPHPSQIQRSLSPIGVNVLPNKPLVGGNSSGNDYQHGIAAIKDSIGTEVNDSPDADDELLNENSARFRKNERERRRRAAMSNGFEALQKMLDISPESKTDKNQILQKAASKIQLLQQRVKELEDEREQLVLALKQRPRFMNYQ